MKEEDVSDVGPSAALAPVRVKQEEVGSSTELSRMATVININNDSSSFNWDED
jgi:hypothetical protein